MKIHSLDFGKIDGEQKSFVAARKKNKNVAFIEKKFPLLSLSLHFYLFFLSSPSLRLEIQVLLLLHMRSTPGHEKSKINQLFLTLMSTSVSAIVEI